MGSNLMCPMFYSFFKKLRFGRRVVTSSLVGIVLSDYSNYILLTEAENVLEQEQPNSTKKPKSDTFLWFVTLNLLHSVHGA